MRIRPLGSNLVFRISSEATTTASGLHLVKLKNYDDWVRGCVEAVGPACTEVRVGDDVLVSRQSVFDVRREGDHVVVVKEAEVMGVCEDGEAVEVEGHAA